MLILLNAGAIVAAAVTAGALAYSNDQVSQIKRNVFDEGVLKTDELEPGDAQNYLIVGVDDGTGAQGTASEARVNGTKLTDSIMVLRLDPATVSASVLSFPRDLLVDIPGRSSRSRINAAFESGGPELLVRTIGENFGIPVHHYLEMNFAGFQELVEIVDGIPVWFPHPTRSRGGGETGDPTVELDIPSAGCWILGPRQALGFARVRKDYQVQDADGDWHTDIGGDYSRVERQQLFIQLAMQQAISKGAKNVNTLRRLIGLGVNSVTIDDQLEPESMVELSRTFRSFAPTDLVKYTLPTDEAPPGGPAYLYLREAEAEPTLALFRGGPTGMTTPVPVADVTVQVRNATGTPNQGRDVTAALGEVGFSTLTVGVDGAVGFPTVVQYAPGAEAKARVVASWLAGDFVYAPEDLPEGVDVVLVTGQGWAGLRPAAEALEDVPEVTPPTTAPGATTTTVPGETTTTAPGATTTPSGDPAAGDVDDPDDDAFYRAVAPPAGASCQRTP
jgi:LCP family protein required for cell wall assembly